MSTMPEQRSPMQDVNVVASLLLLAVRAGAVTVEVFLHKNFGARYFGGQALAALLLVPLFGALLFPFAAQGPLLVFLGLFLVGCASARAEARRLQRKGLYVHGLYSGWPRLLKATASASQERRVKQLGEPFLVGLWGAAIYLMNQPLGAYLIFAAVSLVVTNGMSQWWLDRKVAGMRDVMFEQQAVTERFKELQNGW